jgi:hypothetical protein
VSEEKAVDFVRDGILQVFSDRNLIPFREPGVEDTVHDDVCYGLVVGMNARASGREHHTRSMFPQKAGDFQPGFDRVDNEPILERPCGALNAGYWFSLRWHGHPARANSWPRWPCHFKLNQCPTPRICAAFSA